MIKINATEINAAVTLLATVAPEVTAAYGLLRVIWTRTNPGKTEDDYRAYLRASSQTNIDETSAVLTADGWVEQPDGSWKKPAPVTPGS